MFPLSKTKLKFFFALSAKKNRISHKLFGVEGIKMLEEAVRSSFSIYAIVVDETKKERFSLPLIDAPVYLCTNSDFLTLSSQVQPEGVLAYVHFPDNAHFGQCQTTVSTRIWEEGPGFILENIQDPGNLGTIIRIADWFGFRHIICNKGTVDVLNPKVLRASMGSFFRVNIEYVEDLAPILAEHSSQIRVADMEGETLAEAPLQGNEFILLGNEANGISDDAHPLKKITIHGKGGAESLNVGVAAGIFAYTLSQKHRI